MATRVKAGFDAKPPASPAPALLSALFLQAHPNALILEQHLSQLDPDQVTTWFSPAMTASQMRHAVQAWIDQEGFSDLPSIELLGTFFDTLKKQIWFRPFRQAGWSPRLIHPWAVLYALRTLAPLYPNALTPQTSDDDGIAPDAAIPPESLTERLIACPWLLVQAGWTPQNVPFPWSHPATLLDPTWTRLALKAGTLTPDACQSMRTFAALVLAFLQTTQRRGHSVLALQASTHASHHWVTQAAQWLDRDPDELGDAIRAMTADAPPSPASALFQHYFAPAFQWQWITSPNAANTRKVALRGHFWQEIRTVQMVRSRLALTPDDSRVPQFPLPDDWEARLRAVTIGPHADPLNTEQRAALRTLWQSPLTILTGPPGSGKTELLACFARIMQDVQHADPSAPAAGRLRWLAPTGKAAEQLAQRLGPLPMPPEDAPRTIHHHFQMIPALFAAPAQNVADACAAALQGGGLVIDEFTMCDTSMLHAVFRVASCYHSDRRQYQAAPFRLILSGDPDQLPPVSPGDPIALIQQLDCHAAPPGVCHPHVALTQIFRNHGALTQIIRAFQTPPQGSWPPSLASQDTVRYHAVGSWDALYNRVDQILLEVPQRYPALGATLPPILCATNAIADTVNDHVQAWRTPNRTTTARFDVGDPVIYRRNDSVSGLVNGSDGTVVSVDGDHGRIAWNLPTGEILTLPYTPQHPIQRAYAYTIHRAQGSEWPVVIVLATPRLWDLDADDDALDSDAGHPRRDGFRGWHDRRLIYTALSRAKESLILIGGLPYAELMATIEKLPRLPRHSQFRNSLQFGTARIPWNPMIRAIPSVPKNGRRSRR